MKKELVGRGANKYKVNHLKEVGETYWQHFKCAIFFAGVMFRLSIVCVVHAFFPQVFQTTASERLNKLLAEMKRCEDDEQPPS